MPTTWLQASNNALTTLATDLAAGATTINLSSIDKMPGSFPFRLTIWRSSMYGYRDSAADPSMEIVEVTGWNDAYYYYGDPAAAEYVILRARENTADVPHLEGDTVALFITAGMIQQLQDAITALEGP